MYSALQKTDPVGPTCVSQLPNIQTFELWPDVFWRDTQHRHPEQRLLQSLPQAMANRIGTCMPFLETEIPQLVAPRTAARHMLANGRRRVLAPDAACTCAPIVLAEDLPSYDLDHLISQLHTLSPAAMFLPERGWAVLSSNVRVQGRITHGHGIS